MKPSGSLKRGALFVVALLLVIWPRLLLSAGWRDLIRLRSENPVIARLIAKADERSLTFHGLLEDIARTDGLVYVGTGQCGHGVRACMPHSIICSGSFRLLRILIDPRYLDTDDAQLTGIIAHELQHAREILSDPTIRNAAAMFMFYKREAPARGAFETAAAILIGDRVTGEMTVGGSDALKLAASRLLLLASDHRNGTR